ncbi:MAG: hypothetical protein OXU61_11680, partial [Gammaproteobacteria bacterium]|nr:hypothetical protein [Gammaproteobacteria bacterium]
RGIGKGFPQSRFGMTRITDAGHATDFKLQARPIVNLARVQCSVSPQNWYFLLVNQWNMDCDRFSINTASNFQFNPWAGGAFHSPRRSMPRPPGGLFAASAAGRKSSAFFPSPRRRQLRWRRPALATCRRRRGGGD